MFDNIRYVKVVVIVVTMGLTITMSSTATAGEVESWMVVSDLIIKGTIIDISAEMDKVEEWLPGTRHPEQPFPVTVLKLESVEVLKGFWTENEIVVTAGGAWPDNYSQSRYEAFPLNVTFNYVVGDEVVLSLWYAPTIRGGSYVVTTDDGRFIKKGDMWEHQWKARKMWTLERIRELANQESPQVLFRESSLVVKGIVEEISTGEAHFDFVSFSVLEVWRGNLDTDRIEFRIACREFGMNPWAILSISKGEVWIVSLHKDETGYCALGGRNGMFKVEDEDVLFAGKMKSAFTERSLRELAASEVQR